ncbi:MNIO family bufferin maturase [Kaarinaea lacus]
MQQPQEPTAQLPFLGYGLGLRTDYYEEILQTNPEVDWFEILSENYMVEGGKPRFYLDQIKERYPLVMHGVSMSIGGSDPLDFQYLQQLKQLITHVSPKWVSDHLCWTGQGGHNLHDLMPLPYTEEVINYVAERIRTVQDFLERPILIENVSSYVSYTHSDMTEWEFYRAVCESSGALMLLDLNNIYVSARNHHFDPLEYINHIPKEIVQQFHLAGHTDYGDYVIDTHDHPVVSNVWKLYETALEKIGPVSTMIERDDNMPAFSELMAELQQARQIGERVIGKAA